jgi:hypothetical protein
MMNGFGYGSGLPVSPAASLFTGSTMPFGGTGYGMSFSAGYPY